MILKEGQFQSANMIKKYVVSLHCIFSEQMEEDLTINSVDIFTKIWVKHRFKETVGATRKPKIKTKVERTFCSMTS